MTIAVAEQQVRPPIARRQERIADDPGITMPLRAWRLLGQSEPMQKLRSSIEKVARLRVSVLIAGESGTGKELVAAEIHARSGRPGAFVPLNCAAIPESLFASELFGHEKGSFTGATRQHQGHFERSHGGTIFLDEVTEMPLPLQATLLRILETGSVARVGGEAEMPLDIRVVASTNRDVLECVKAGTFRADLYYRLNEFFVAVPPLRMRGDDVILLAETFVAELNERHGTRRRLATEGLRKLREYSWPGNVRELRHAIQRSFVLADTDDAQLTISRVLGQDPSNLLLRPGLSIEQMERRLIDITMEHFRGDKKRSAEALGISVRTLYNRLHDYQRAPADGF